MNNHSYTWKVWNMLSLSSFDIILILRWFQMALLTTPIFHRGTKMTLSRSFLRLFLHCQCLSFVSSKAFLDIQATIECGFTLKRVRDMIRRYSQYVISWPQPCCLSNQLVHLLLLLFSAQLICQFFLSLQLVSSKACSVLVVCFYLLLDVVLQEGSRVCQRHLHIFPIFLLGK